LRLYTLSQLAKIADRFNRRVLHFKSCCDRIERQFSLGALRVTDVELVYASSFLSVCAQWEALLEEILLEAVCGETSIKKGNTRLATFKHRNHLRSLLLIPGKNYVSIESLRRAEDMAALFVTNGRPFSAVGDDNRTHIQQAVWIRNAIAHQSAFATGVFRDKVPGVGSLPTSKRSPGAFLRHEFRVSPSQRRYELYFAAFQSAAKQIAEAW
jgi:hypothetical protein